MDIWPLYMSRGKDMLGSLNKLYYYTGNLENVNPFLRENRTKSAVFRRKDSGREKRRAFSSLSDSVRSGMIDRTADRKEGYSCAVT